MASQEKDKNIHSIIANNNKASYEYFLHDTIEAGLVLTGTEVKSLRKNKTSLADSHAALEGNQVFIYNLHIPEYSQANRFNHYPLRPRKLLLHKRQIKKFIGLIQQKGMTLIPLKMYFNRKNLAKVLIAVASGKKQHDKRNAIKERDWNRDKARIMKE